MSGNVVVHVLGIASVLVAAVCGLYCCGMCIWIGIACYVNRESEKSNPKKRGCDGAQHQDMGDFDGVSV
jgi:hypothetical protein